jgi:hypothetical protein
MLQIPRLGSGSEKSTLASTGFNPVALALSADYLLNHEAKLKVADDVDEVRDCLEKRLGAGRMSGLELYYVDKWYTFERLVEAYPMIRDDGNLLSNIKRLFGDAQTFKVPRRYAGPRLLKTVLPPPQVIEQLNKAKTPTALWVEKKRTAAAAGLDAPAKK